MIDSLKDTGAAVKEADQQKAGVFEGYTARTPLQLQAQPPSTKWPTFGFYHNSGYTCLGVVVVCCCCFVSLISFSRSRRILQHDVPGLLSVYAAVNVVARIHDIEQAILAATALPIITNSSAALDIARSGFVVLFLLTLDLRWFQPGYWCYAGSTTPTRSLCTAGYWGGYGEKSAICTGPCSAGVRIRLRFQRPCTSQFCDTALLRPLGCRWNVAAAVLGPMPSGILWCTRPCVTDSSMHRCV